MPDRNQPALDFLLSRRSRPAKPLTGPAPDRDARTEILTAAARTPEHGKLEPWRFIVLERGALDRLADLAKARGEARGHEARDGEKAGSQFADSPRAVVVVESPVISDKIPVIEQTYSAGAVALSLLNAALAAGWGANWLTGWVASDPVFTTAGLGLSPHERVVGTIHIGTATAAPPDRPRPDLERIVTWRSA